MSIIKETFDNIPNDSRIFVKRLDEISKRVKAILDSKGWSQVDLANQMGKKPSEISRWLNTPHNLTLKTISKLEATLNESLITIPNSYFIEHDDDTVTHMTLVGKTDIPTDEITDDSNYKEPKGSERNILKVKTAADG